MLHLFRLILWFSSDVCAFLRLGIKRRNDDDIGLVVQVAGSLALFSLSPPPPLSSSASSCIIKIIAANVDEILFLLVPFCVVSSPLPASVAQFIYSCHSPPSLALLSFAHVLVWSSSPSCSVSFSQFQNSLCLSLSLSLFAGTVCLKPDGSVCLACVVSFRYYIEFNDII